MQIGNAIAPNFENWQPAMQLQNA